MSVTDGELEFVAAEITRRIGYVDISVGRRGRFLPYRCADLLAAQQAGLDPTADWRRRAADNQEAFSGAPPPPQVAAAFVLQWYLGVLAVPTAWAAVLGPWVLDPSPEALTFDLAEPEAFPCAVTIQPSGVETIADEGERLERAHARYLEHAEAFADSYRPPEVRVGSGQRGGLVHDAWTMALQDAQAAMLPPGRAPATRARRRGCCMMYALPGASPCTACPRLSRRR